MAIQSRAATYQVTSAADSGTGTLRQAIINANASPGADVITFSIAGSGIKTITPLSALPAITDPVTIDGTTQPGYAGTPLIELNGTSAGSATFGFRLLVAGNVIRGLAINRFHASGIDIESPGTNVVAGNFIGCDPAGTVARANLSEGILINGSYANVIGGTNSLDRNVITSSGDSGIYLLNGGGNTVQGNYIGLQAGGTLALANTNDGITLYNSASNLIGGTISAARNVVSGNKDTGIFITGSGAKGNRIQGNYVGTDASGTVAVPNSADGILIESGAFGNTFGGTTSGAGNLVSGNSQAGFFLDGGGVGANIIQGNFIGTDVSGKLALGNTLAGMTLLGATNNLIGGTTAGARNLISGNKQDGIYCSTNSNGNIIQGNFIGTDLTGTNRLGNALNGLFFSAANFNVVGGTIAAARNILSGNTNRGIYFMGSAASNVVQGNYIGTDKNGTRALPNSLSGMRIESPSNTIGGAVSGAGNLISGNSSDGILLYGAGSTANIIQGNYVGTTVTGSAALPNGQDGLGISGAARNTIGGPGAGNLISGNSDSGIFIATNGANANVIQGNYIGTDITGMFSVGNSAEGIYMETVSSNLIGGATSGAGNVISGNGRQGIFMTNTTWNAVQGNKIGVKADGVSGLGNVTHDVELQAGANNNLIGGSGIAGNRIGFAIPVGGVGYTGIRVRPGSFNNQILGNSIFSNSGLGVDLGTFGVNANDPCDADGFGLGADANRQINFPVLAEAMTGTGTGVRGSMVGQANASYLLQFFGNPACDPSGNGQGQIYLGDANLTLGVSCTSSFVAQLPIPLPVGYSVSATATALTGTKANNTSEFSPCVPVVSMPALAVNETIAGLGHGTNFVLTSKQVIFSWPNSASVVLKQTTNLFPPVVWTKATNIPVLVNGKLSVTLPFPGSSVFYRLSYE